MPWVNPYKRRRFTLASALALVILVAGVGSLLVLAWDFFEHSRPRTTREEALME